MKRTCFLLSICILAMSWAAPSLAQNEKVFFGSLHSHTKYSDGTGTPEDAYRAARQAGLDFLAITEHNHSRCEDGAAADRRDGIMIATQPELYTGRAEGVKPEEVAEAAYLKYLNLGFHIAPTGDQDNHYANWGTETNARTGVITDGLTRAKILAAMDARHVYATEDKNLKVIFRVNGHLCGDRLAPPNFGSELTIQYTIEDGDAYESDATYQIDVFSGTIGGGEAHIIETVNANGNTVDGIIEDVRYTGGAQYVFFRITQIHEGEEGSDHDRAWTAPVWFDAGADVTPPPVALTEVASRNSAIYHVSLECLDAQRIKPNNLLRGAEAKQSRTLHPGCPRKAQ